MEHFFNFTIMATLEFFISFFLIIQGILVLIQNPKKPLNRSFFFFELAVFIWIFSMALAYTMSDPPVAFLLTQFGMIGVTYIPISTYAFSVYFAGDARQRKIIIAGLIMTILTTFLVGHPSFSETVFQNKWGYYIQLGPLSYTVLVLFLIFISLFIVNLYRAYAKAVPEQKRWYFSTLIAGMLSFFGVLDFLPAYGVTTFLPFGYVFVAVFSTLMSYFILRHNLANVTIISGRDIGYFLLRILLLLIFTIFFILFLREQDTVANALMHGVFFFSALFILSVLRDKAQRLIEEIFFKEKINFNALISQFSMSLRNLRDPSSLLTALFDFADHDLRIDFPIFGSVEKNALRMNLYFRGSPQPIYTEIPELKSIENYFVRNPRAIFIGESNWGFYSSENGVQAIAASFRSYGAKILIPIVKSSALIGFLALGKKQSKKNYAREELQILDTLGVSLAIAWENAVHYEKMQQTIALKSDFVSISAHLLRTPLHSARWTFEVLLKNEGNTLTPRQLDLLKSGYAAVRSMNELVQRFLDLIGVDRATNALRTVSCDVRSLIDEIEKELHELFQTKKLSIVHHVPHIPSIVSDKFYIKTILMVLYENAYHYSPDSSVITVSVQLKDNALVFSIADKGIGIAQKDQPNIFHQFFRAQNAFDFYPNGSGLGLYYAKKLITLLRGSIWFHSVEGQGTTFFVSFPLAVAED